MMAFCSKCPKCGGELLRNDDILTNETHWKCVVCDLSDRGYRTIESTGTEAVPEQSDGSVIIDWPDVQRTLRRRELSKTLGTTDYLTIETIEMAGQSILNDLHPEVLKPEDLTTLLNYVRHTNPILRALLIDNTQVELAESAGSRVPDKIFDQQLDRLSKQLEKQILHTKKARRLRDEMSLRRDEWMDEALKGRDAIRAARKACEEIRQGWNLRYDTLQSVHNVLVSRLKKTQADLRAATNGEPVPAQLSIDEYQAQTVRTVNSNAGLINYCFGMIGETGEVVDLIKKHLYQGHSMEQIRDKVKSELGDVIWYMCRLATECGISMGDVLESNVAKLAARYPDGFSVERSIKREEAAE